MYKNKLITKKGVLGKIVGCMALLVTIASTIPVISEATSNYDWSAYASTSGATIKTGKLSKVTTSSIFVNYSSGNSTVLYASVWANWGMDDSTYTNVTYYTLAHPNYPIYKSVSSFTDVLNSAHETYGDCMVQVRFTPNASGSHSGKWRADY